MPRFRVSLGITSIIVHPDKACFVLKLTVYWQRIWFIWFIRRRRTEGGVEGIGANRGSFLFSLSPPKADQRRIVGKHDRVENDETEPVRFRRTVGVSVAAREARRRRV